MQPEYAVNINKFRQCSTVNTNNNNNNNNNNIFIFFVPTSTKPRA